jgi:hypothetical protein
VDERGISGVRLYAVGYGYVWVDCGNCPQTFGEKGFRCITKTVGR